MPEPPPPRVRKRLRELPSVDRLATSVARAELAERRAELLAGAVDDADLEKRARERLKPSLRRVLNATGVVVHTNLGRAPLAASARAAVTAAAEGYSNLELDLASGGRGSRHGHVEGLLREVTGAQAALAVNNCAAAVLLAAAALAGPGREVVVSRGQLIEIGGGFRIPEVVGQAGAQLVEVGTTNRTRLGDYAAALGERGVPAPPARARRAHRQALARRARGDAGALPRPRARPRRAAGAGHARCLGADARGPRAAAGRGLRRRGRRRDRQGRRRRPA